MYDKCSEYKRLIMASTVARVTVGIPYHSSVNPIQLKKAIDSILNQTLRPSEVHLLRDGKVSGELQQVVEGYQDEIIKHFNFDQNRGLAAVLNYSLKETTTEYYARMDADDIAFPNRLEIQLRFLEENKNVDILGSWVQEINNDGKKEMIRKVPELHADIIKNIWACPLIHPTVVFRTASIRDTTLFYNERLRRRQDYELWYRCVKEGLVFHNISKPLLFYRFTEDWFAKNNFSVIWEQVKIGWRGNWLLKMPLKSYIGAAFPLIKTILPAKAGVQLTKYLKKIDPRNKV